MFAQIPGTEICTFVQFFYFLCAISLCFSNSRSVTNLTPQDLQPYSALFCFLPKKVEKLIFNCSHFCS